MFHPKTVTTLFMLVATLTVSDASLRGSKQTNDSETLERSLVRSSAQYETKLVGGNDASKGEYPFFAHWDGCGASVIHDDLVLSAAHCNVPGAGSKVIIGPYNLNDLAGATQRTIVAKAAHPKYDDNDDTLPYDFIIDLVTRSCLFVDLRVVCYIVGCEEVCLVKKTVLFS